MALGIDENHEFIGETDFGRGQESLSTHGAYSEKKLPTSKLNP